MAVRKTLAERQAKYKNAEELVTACKPAPRSVPMASVIAANAEKIDVNWILAALNIIIDGITAALVDGKITFSEALAIAWQLIELAGQILKRR
jgi:hypothetical protein